MPFLFILLLCLINTILIYKGAIVLFTRDPCWGFLISATNSIYFDVIYKAVINWLMCNCTICSYDLGIKKLVAIGRGVKVLLQGHDLSECVLRVFAVKVYTILYYYYHHYCLVSSNAM